MTFARLPLLLLLAGCLDSDARLSELEQEVQALRALLDDGACECEGVKEYCDATPLLLEPSTPGSLQQTITDLSCFIKPGTIKRIELADGTYPMTGPLIVGHPQGEQLEIIGNAEDPSDVILEFSGSAGLTVTAGQVARLSGVTLRGDGTAATGQEPDRNGIFVSSGSVELGPVNIENFGDYGVYVVNGGTLNTQPDSLRVVDAGKDGIIAGHGGVVNAQGVQIEDPGDSGIVATTGGYVHAEDAIVLRAPQVSYFTRYGGTLFAPTANASGAGEWGFLAEHSDMIVPGAVSNARRTGFGTNTGMIHAEGATARESTGGSGFVAARGGQIFAEDSASTDNSRHGYRATTAGIIHGNDATASGNSSGGVAADSDAYIYGVSE